MTTTTQKLFNDNLCPVCLNRHPGLCIPARDPLPEPSLYLSGNGRTLGTFVKAKEADPIVYLSSNGEFKTIANDGVLDQLIKEKEEKEAEEETGNCIYCYYELPVGTYGCCSSECSTYFQNALYEVGTFEPIVYLSSNGEFKTIANDGILDQLIKEKEEQEAEEETGNCIYCYYKLPVGAQGCCCGECSTYYHN